MNEINKESLAGQKEWLDHFYQEMYLQVGFGPRQNEYYMNMIIKNLDDRVIKFLKEAPASIVDVGCAMGYGTILLGDIFPLAKLYGIEVNETAVAGGRERFPQITFIHNRDGLIDGLYDIVISSHCLEHYLDPQELLADLLRISCRYCIVMVPYNEDPPQNKHLCTITENTFPDKLVVEGKHYIKISSVIYGADRELSRNDLIQVTYEVIPSALPDIL